MNERLSENSYTNDIISKYIRFSSNSLHTKNNRPHPGKIDGYF